MIQIWSLKELMKVVMCEFDKLNIESRVQDTLTRYEDDKVTDMQG